MRGGVLRLTELSRSVAAADEQHEAEQRENRARVVKSDRAAEAREGEK